jgi:hypothetical protein
VLCSFLLNFSKFLMKKYSLLSSLVGALVIGLLAAAPAAAQTPSTGGPTPQADPTAVPLDGGASLLLASGVAFGLKKLRNRRRIS